MAVRWLPAFRRQILPIQLPTFLIGVLGLQIVTVVTVFGSCLSSNENKAADQFASQLQTELTTRTVYYLDSYLATPHLINQINNDAIKDKAAIESTLTDANLAEIEDLLFERIQQFDIDSVSFILFGSADGEIRAACRHCAEDAKMPPALDSASDPTTDSQSWNQDWDWYEAAAAAGRPIQRLISSENSAQQDYSLPPSLLTSRPTYAASSGELLGVFAVVSSLEPLHQFMANLDASDSYSFVVDQDGRLISAPPPNGTLRRDRPPPVPTDAQQPQALNPAPAHPLIPAISQQISAQLGDWNAVQTAQHLRLNTGLSQPHLARVVPYTHETGLNWQIVTVAPESAFQGGSGISRGEILLLTGLLLLGTVAIYLWLAHWLVRPLRELHQAVQTCDGEPLSFGSRPVYLQEVAQAQQAVTELQDRLQHRLRSHYHQYYHQKLERQVAQKTAALEASRSELQTVLDNAVAVILKLRIFPNKQVEYDVISQRCEQLFGYTAEDFFTDRWSDRHTKTKNDLWRSRIHPDDLEQTINPTVEQIIQTRSTYETQMEYRFRKKDDSYCWVLSRGVYIWNEAEGCWNATIVESDISDRKQAELALQESESRFRDIAKTISQLFLVRALTGEFLYISPAYDAIWGRSRERLYADPSSWMEAIHPDDRDQVKQSLQQQFSGTAVSREYRIVRPDGAVRWIYAQIQQMRDESGTAKYYVGFAEDISDRKHVEQQLQQVVAEKDALLQEIQHRVKNNLQLILSMLNMQQRRITNSEVGGVLRDVSNRIRVISLVHDLLYQGDNQAEVNLARYVSMLVKQVAATYGSESAAIAFDIQAEAIVIPSKAASICGLILNELLTNVLKYAFPDRLETSPSGGQSGRVALDAPDEETANEPDETTRNAAAAPPTITIFISEIYAGDSQPGETQTGDAQTGDAAASPSGAQPETRGQAPTRHVQMIVADNGVGLPPSFDLATSRSLGLLLVQGFVDQLHGSLTLRRHPGTQFCITFPHT